jgi:hypothetical protein
MCAVGGQTAMRCWDALLSEGAKVLYRVALALLKTHEDVLLAQDNAGYVLREMKLASAAVHDRDALLKARPPSALAREVSNPRPIQDSSCRKDYTPSNTQ